MGCYVLWKTGKTAKDKKKIKEAEENREKLRSMEEPFTYNKIVVLRKYGAKIIEQEAGR